MIRLVSDGKGGFKEVEDYKLPLGNTIWDHMSGTQKRLFNKKFKSFKHVGKGE